MTCRTDWQFILLALNIEEGAGNQEEQLYDSVFSYLTNFNVTLQMLIIL